MRRRFEDEPYFCHARRGDAVLKWSPRANGHCLWCGKPLGEGRHPGVRFCSLSCRVQACKARKKLEVAVWTNHSSKP